MHNMRLRQQPGFIALILSQSLGSFNDNLMRAAFLSLFLINNPHSLIESSIASALIVLPSIFLPAIAARLSERYGMINILQWCKGIETVAVCTGLIGFTFHNTVISLSAIMLLGIQIALSSPSRYSIIPKVLPEPLWLRANGILEAYSFIGILIGTLIGSSIALSPHPITFLWILGAVALIIGIYSVLTMPKDIPDNTNIVIQASTIFRLREDMTHTFRIPKLPPYIYGVAWFWSIGLAVLTLLPPIIHDHLHGTPGNLTLLLTVFVLGMGIGSGIAPWFAKKLGLRNTVTGSLSVMAIALFTAGYIHHIEGVSVSMLITAVAGGVFSVPIMTELQEHSPPQCRARVIGSMGAICSLAMVLLVITIGIMGKIHIPSHYILMLIAACNAIFASQYYRILPKSIPCKHAEICS